MLSGTSNVREGSQAVYTGNKSSRSLESCGAEIPAEDSFSSEFVFRGNPSKYKNQCGVTSPAVAPVPNKTPQRLEGTRRRSYFKPENAVFAGSCLGECSKSQELRQAMVSPFSDNAAWLSAPLLGNENGNGKRSQRQRPQLRTRTQGVGPKLGTNPHARERFPLLSEETALALNRCLLEDFKHLQEGYCSSKFKRKTEHSPTMWSCHSTVSEGRESLRQRVNCSESLDYEPIQNSVFIKRLQKKNGKDQRHIYGYSGRTLAKFLITMHAGLVIGLIAIAISSASKNMISWKNHVVMSLCDLTSQQGMMAATIFHMTYSLGLVVIAVTMVQFWAPEAAGAGVSLVIAYLNGNHVPNLFHLRTLVTKIVGTMCGLSANLFLGPEGPMVHVGAAVASVLTYMECWGCCIVKQVKPAKLYLAAEPVDSESTQTLFYTTNHDIKDTGAARGRLQRFCKFLSELYSDVDRRELLSAGAGAGIAAAFGAPIGGVLFAMEEAATYWSKKVAWRCFLCAVAAVMTLNWVQPLLGPDCKDGSQSLVCDTNKTGMLSFEKGLELEIHDWVIQTPCVLGISVIAGLVGVLFNSSRILLWRVRAPPDKHALRVLEAVGVTVVTVFVIFAVSGILGKCRTILDAGWEEEDAFLQFNCAEGKHNDLASAFMAAPEVTIKRLFSLGSELEDDDMKSAHKKAVEFYDSHFTIPSLFTFVPFYLVVMSLGAGIAIPGGLFLPAIMVGGATGALYGRLMHRLGMHFGYYKIQPGLYALLGATGSLAAVFRSSISLVVIVIEGTRSIQHLFVVVLAVVISNWVAHHVHHHGVYESELERVGNMQYLEQTAPRALFFMTAEEVMASDVHTFRTIEKVSYVLRVLRETTCNGFPVIGRDERDAHGKLRVGRLEGLILRSQLLVMLRRRVFCDPWGVPKTKVDEEEVDAEMRNFYRSQHTHHRFLATSEEMVDSLELDWVQSVLTPRWSEEPRGLHGSLNETSNPLTPIFGNRLCHFHQTPPLLAGTMYMDLRPYMNRAPLTVRQECSAARAYELFTALGLRHLCVVNDHNEVTGIVTRKDLDHAAGHGWWRISRIAPRPERHHILFRNNQSTLAESINLWSSNELSNLHSAEASIQCDDKSSPGAEAAPGSYS